MMKKVLFGLSAILALFATSCQNELEQTVATGDTSTVTFEVAIPELATRAYSDGQTAKVLHYAVYDAKQVEGTDIVRYLDGLKPAQWPKFAEDQLTTTVNLELVTGNTYRIAFWAAADDAPYKFDPASATVKVIYDDAAKCNDEKRDAFFGNTAFTVEGNTTIDVTLTRPFAQLNIGTNDYEAAEAANFIPTLSKVTVKNIYSALNLVSGEVEGEREVEFGYGEIAKGETFPVAGYKYLAMNYLLVGKEKSVIDVVFSYQDTDYDAKTRSVGSVPVERNYRTNIYGKILTSSAELNVTIDPVYKTPDNKVNPVVVDAAGLQAALDAAGSGVTTIISLIKDIEGDVIDFQRPDRHIIIEGGNNKYNGTIRIHNGSSVNNGSITIKNVNFETSTPSLNFIMPSEFGIENGVNRRYSNNVSVENCTFTATGEAENTKTVVGVQAKSTFGYLKVINCTATGLHSLIQAQSCAATVTVEGSTINGKNGVAFKQVNKAIVKENEITAAGYGIRFDGNIDNYGIEVADNKINATQPFIVRKMTGKNNTIALTGTNEFTTTEDYQIVITDGSDDAEYKYPTGSYTLTGAINGYSIYPINTTGDAFQAAINNATGEITLPGNLTSIGKGFEVKKDMIFNFDNKVLNAGSTADSTWYAIQATGDYDVFINDANFTRAGVFASDGANVVFNSGVINHKPERTSRYIFCAHNGSTITVKDGTFKNDRAKNSYFWADAATIIVKGGDFGGVASTNKVVTTNGGQVIIKGGTFNFDPKAWVAEGYKTIKKGSIWMVVPSDVYMPENTDALKADLAAAANGGTVILSEGKNYGTIEVGTLKDVTIEGANSTMIFKTTDATVLEDVTLKNINFEYTGATTDFGVVINAAAQIENLVIENSTFTGTGAKAGRGIYGQNPNATIVVKGSTFKNLGYPIYTMAGGGYKSLTVENCTFDEIKSWAIMPQYNDYTGDLTVTGCNFVNCVGGLVKAGKFVAGKTFTFTNNVITNSSEHPAKNWFTINTSDATSIVDGNKKDGAAWNPGTAEGLN